MNTRTKKHRTRSSGGRIILALGVASLVSLVVIADAHAIGRRRTPPPASAAPIGALEAIDAAGTVSGWALDPDDPGRALEVRLFVDGPAGGGGRVLASVRANRSRPDVNRATGHPGDHGFSFTVPGSLLGSNRELFAYAVDADGSGRVALLAGSPKAIAGSTAPPPPPPPSPDAAEIVSATIPASIGVGQRAPVSVVVRNTGQATWTRSDGFKLGAIDDSRGDAARLMPGGGVRVYLPRGARVAPGQTHTFAFEIEGPARSGTLRPAWRMVHEAVRWFGQRAEATVTVTAGAPPPPPSPRTLAPITTRGDRFHSGGQATFLTTDFLTAVRPGDDIIRFNTHCYLGMDASRRRRIREAMVREGYNSIYIYTLNQGDYRGASAGNVVTPYGSDASRFSMTPGSPNRARITEWQAALQELIDLGIRPVIWLAADDSPEIRRASLGDFNRYVDDMVQAFESLPILWVIGLEVDEYWSEGAVARRRAHLQSRTRHPVGVHLTTGESRNVNTPYKRGFDFVCLQLENGMDLSGYRADSRRLMTGDRPYIAAEFNVRDRGNDPTITDHSQAIGGAIRSTGRAAGLGNGAPRASSAPTPTPAPSPAPPPAGGVDQIDLSTVTWLHTDVSGWPRTSTITNVDITDARICIDHTERGQWPVRNINGTDLAGNPWVFVKRNGQWYAATYEWLRPGQHCKALGSNPPRVTVADQMGNHIKRAPLDSWRPRSGELVGFMVSTLARDGNRTVPKRSNVVTVRWP